MRRFGVDNVDATIRHGLRLHRGGSGPPLLLIHGFGASSFTWRHVMTPMAKHFRVLAPDLLGVGGSTRPAGADYSLEGHVQRLEAILHEEGITEARVVGNSYGGAVALLLTAHHPVRTSRLVLLAPAVFVERTPLLIRALRSPLLGPLAARVPARWAARIALRRAYADPSKVTAGAVRGYAQDLRDPGARRALRRTALSLPQCDPAGLQEIVRQVNQPTLILWGQGDRILPVEQGVRLQRALPQARLLLLPAVGHAPQEEDPQALLDAALPFLMAQSVFS